MDASRDARLRVIRDHVVLTDRVLQATLTIGRAPDNDLVLDDERVSGHHGRLERITGAPAGGARWRYTDLGSSNGTSLAGSGVLRAGEAVELREDSQLLLGDTVLDLLLGGEAEAPADETASADAGVTGDGANAGTHASRGAGAGVEAAGDGTLVPSAPPGRPRVVVVTGGRAVTLPVRGRSAVIGRGAGCELRIEDPSVSALQARLVHEDGRWLLSDLSASNPTRLHLHRVAGREAVGDGAHIIAGAADLLLVIDDEDEPPAARAALEERALQLAQHDERLSAARAREARAALAAGDLRLGEILVGRGWLSPGAWVELLAEAQAPQTVRVNRTGRARIVLAGVLLAAALAVGAWFALSGN